MADNLLDPIEPQIDPNKDYYAELVGEGKRFKDPQVLARSKVESDLYIKHLEQTRDEMRQDYLRLQEEYKAGPKLQELIDKLSAAQPPSSNEPPPAKDVQQQPVFDPKQIESLVSNKVQEIESTKRQQENFNTVRSKLIERFGTNYQSAFKSQIENLGLTEDFVNQLARTHPTVLFKTFGFDEQPRREGFQAPPSSGNRTSGFAPTEQKRTWTYYQNLRRTNPTLYQNPKTQVQMHQDRIALGEDFKDGDYSSYGD